MELRDPKEITITDGKGVERQFILSTMSAWDGLEIMTRMPPNLAMLAVPKIGDWEIVRELSQKILKYVGVEVNGKVMPLTTQAFMDNHAGDWTCLKNLLIEEVKYNNSFFRDGKISDFFAEAFQVALAKITEILNQSSGRSSPTEKPVSTSSGQSIA